MPFEERVTKTANILKITEKKLKNALEHNGVDGVEILNASTTSHNDIQGILQTITPKSKPPMPLLKIKAASAILKGENPFSTEPKIVELPTQKRDTSVLADLIKSQRPVEQWSDEEVLSKYVTNDDDRLESELQRRAKNRPFIILKEGTQEEVDIEASLVMLKKARKEEIPSTLIKADKSVVHIYKVEAYHVANRIRYESPIRPGVMLFDGYCQVSKQNFKNVGDPARKMLRLIHDFEGELSRMEESNLIDIAEKKGIDGLGRMFPEVHEKYLELASTDSLPSLKRIAPVESRQADPFYSNGNHKRY